MTLGAGQSHGSIGRRLEGWPQRGESAGPRQGYQSLSTLFRCDAMHSSSLPLLRRHPFAEHRNYTNTLVFHHLISEQYTEVQIALLNASRAHCSTGQLLTPGAGTRADKGTRPKAA